MSDSPPRMNLLVQALQPLSGDMGIDLRTRQIGVAEHDLDTPEICPVFEQMRSKRVPQCMW